MSDGHGVYFHNDDQDFPYATCDCGWRSPPAPDVETAADFYGEHRAIVVDERVVQLEAEVNWLCRALLNVADNLHGAGLISAVARDDIRRTAEPLDRGDAGTAGDQT